MIHAANKIFLYSTLSFFGKHLCSITLASKHFQRSIILDKSHCEEERNRQYYMNKIST